jgi:hypothetical protein
VTCGATARENHSEDREEREAQIVELMRQNVPMVNISELLGISYNYLHNTLRPNLIRKYGLDYKPVRAAIGEVAPGLGLSDDARTFLSRLGGFIYSMRHKKALSAVEVGRLTGLSRNAQAHAMNASRHNWTVSQIDRMATANGHTFKEVVIDSMIDVIDLPTVIRRIVPSLRRQTEEQREAIKCSISLLNSSS